MTKQTHRAGITPRSGDTHVIDPTKSDAVAVNVDAIARDSLVEPVKRRAAKPKVAKPKAAKPKAAPAKVGGEGGSNSGGQRQQDGE